MDAAEGAAQKLLQYFEEAQRLHEEATGKPLKPYKPTEPDRLRQVFEVLFGVSQQGPDFLATVVHELIWAQCLANANHRTTVLFLQAFLYSCDIDAPHYASDAESDNRFLSSLTSFFGASKKYLDRQSEWGYNPRQVKRQHYELVRTWLLDLVGPQSGALMTVGPQRLMTFCS